MSEERKMPKPATLGFEKLPGPRLRPAQPLTRLSPRQAAIASLYGHSSPRHASLTAHPMRRKPRGRGEGFLWKRLRTPVPDRLSDVRKGGRRRLPQAPRGGRPSRVSGRCYRFSKSSKRPRSGCEAEGSQRCMVNGSHGSGCALPCARPPFTVRKGGCRCLPNRGAHRRQPLLSRLRRRRYAPSMAAVASTRPQSGLIFGGVGGDTAERVLACVG
jgi:hypothetical protein